MGRVRQGAESAEVRQLPGVTAAVFPEGPERGVYNDALLDRDISAMRAVRRSTGTPSTLQ